MTALEALKIVKETADFLRICGEGKWDDMADSLEEAVIVLLSEAQKGATVGE